MKKLIIIGILPFILLTTGCDMSHNFMDVDNPNAKEDLKYYLGSGNIPKINVDDLIPESFSGTRKDAKGYANKYYEDNLQEYVGIAKDGLSGARESLKGYYNEGVDELNKKVSDKVNGAISGELNKFKIN